MKKTVISATIVGLTLASFKSDMDKAGDWYDAHQGAVDGAITTAATVGKALAYENDNQFGIEQRAEWAAKHAGDIAKVAGMLGDENEFGVKQRAEFVAKHAGTIARIAGMLGDENDDEFGIKQRAEFVAKHGKTIARIASMFGDANDNQLDFKSDMDKAGDWYKDHSGAVDGAITTAATVGKILADQDDEFGVKQRAEFVAKHAGTIARIAGMLGDENDDQFGSIGEKAKHFFEYGPELELGLKQDADKAGDFYNKHYEAIDSVIRLGAAIGGVKGDNQLDFKSDMDKAGDWYKDHSGAVDGAITTAATVGKILADENEVNEYLRHDSNLKSLKGLDAPVRRGRGFLGH